MTSSFIIPPPFGMKSRACLERHGIYLRKPANLFWTFRMFRKGLTTIANKKDTFVPTEHTLFSEAYKRRILKDRTDRRRNGWLCFHGKN